MAQNPYFHPTLGIFTHPRPATTHGEFIPPDPNTFLQRTQSSHAPSARPQPLQLPYSPLQDPQSLLGDPRVVSQQSFRSPSSQQSIRPAQQSFARDPRDGYGRSLETERLIKSEGRLTSSRLEFFAPDGQQRASGLEAHSAYPSLSSSRDNFYLDPSWNSGVEMARDLPQRPPHTYSLAEGNNGSTEFLSAQRQHAKKFLLCLFHNGIKYNDLAADTESQLDPVFLKSLYQELGLDTGQEQHTSEERFALQLSKTTTAKSGQAETGLPTAQAQQNLANAVRDSSRITRSSPITRKDYIARLMAAKTNKEVAPGTQILESPEARSNEVDNGLVLNEQQGWELAPQNKAETETELDLANKRRAQTELARRRMEALALARSASGGKRMTHVANEDGEPVSRLYYANNEQQLGPDASSLVERRPRLSTSNQADDDRNLPVQSLPQQNDVSRYSSPLARIPGLFMTYPSVPSPQENANVKEVTVGIHTALHETVEAHTGMKRHINSDSELSSARSSKRRFGQWECEDGLIIEASDDETGLDDGNNEHAFGVPGRDLAQVTSQNSDLDFEKALNSGRRISVDAPVNDVEDYGTIQTYNLDTATVPSPAGEHRDLKRHEANILVMKRKIAELEQRRKARLSGTATPASFIQEGSNLPTAANPDDTEGAPCDHVPQDGHADDVESRHAADGASTSNSELSARAATHSSASRSDELITRTELSPGQTPVQQDDWKKRRRLEIQNSIPTIDARFSSNSSKLVLLRAQMQELENAIQQEQSDRKRLVDELGSLDVAAEEASTLKLPVPEGDLVASGSNVETNSARETSDASRSSETKERRDSDIASNIATSHEREAQCQLEASMAQPGTTRADESHSRVEDDIDSVSAWSPRAPTQSCSDEGELQHSEAMSSNLHDEELSSNHATSSEDVQMEESGGSESGELVVESDANSQEPFDKGQAGAMSESGREDNVPMEEVEVTSEQESDEYEPPEIEMPANTRAESVIREQSEAYEPPRPQPDEEAPSMPHADFGDMPPAPHYSKVDTSAYESKAAHGQDGNNEQRRGLDNFSVPHAERFTPYESPLKTFKGYRYHPAFTQNVPGGFRSATYSHNIDPNKQICPFEAVGGVCRDAECDGQHFQSMNIRDEIILLQLGTNNPGRSEEQKQAWTSSLKGLLEDLRQRRINDAQVVAFEIAELRRRFFNDESRVLDL